MATVPPSTPSLPPHGGLSSFRLGLRLMMMAVLLVALLGAMVFALVDRIFATLTPSMRYDLAWKARHGVQELAATADLSVVAHDRDSIAAAARELIGVTNQLIKDRIDVVVLDVMMPTIRGDRLATLLRKHSQLRNLGVVLVSSHPAEELAALASEVDAAAVVSKRDARDTLVPAVLQAVRGSRPRPSLA